MTSGMDVPGGGTARQAGREAAGLGQHAAQAAGHVAQEARQQGRHVAAEGRQRARDLVSEVSDQARGQAEQQQQRAAESLRTLGSQLRSMAEGDGQDGLAAQVVRRGADAAEQAAGWLDARQPGDLVREVRDYASRHPGTFLAGAALAGLLAGRLTRALTGDNAGGGRDGAGMPAGREAGPADETALQVPPSARAAVPMRHGPFGTEVGP